MTDRTDAAGDTSDDGSSPVRPRIPSPEAKSVVEAYYGQVLDWANRVRTQAQAGFGVASLVASSLVIAGFLSEIQNRDGEIVALGIIALVAWFVTGGTFIYAIAVPIPDPPDEGDLDLEERAYDILHGAASATHQVEGRLTNALWVTALSVLLTIAAVAAVVATGPRVDRTYVGLTVTPNEAQVLNSECPSLALPNTTGQFQFNGNVANQSVEQPLVNVAVPTGTCRGQSLEVPRDAIEGVQTCQADGLAAFSRAVTSRDNRVHHIGSAQFVDSATSESTTTSSVTTTTTQTRYPGFGRCSR